MWKKVVDEFRNNIPDNFLEVANPYLDVVFKNENDRKNAAQILRILTSNRLHELKVPPEMAHQLNSIPRGYCLVINVYRYHGTEQCRNGSDKDYISIQKLWKSLGYEVMAYQNKTKNVGDYNDLTAQNINQLVEEFAQMESHENVESAVVIIMTHGRADPSNNKSVNLLGSDQKKINTERLINHFCLFKAPHLAHKPKLFFFQVCRTFCSNQTDNGTPNEPGMDISGEEDDIIFLETDEAETDQQGATSVDLRFDSGNQLIVFPTTPGSKSIRSPTEGSWFIQAMCKVFSVNAYDTDLETMLDMMSDYIRMHYVNQQEGDMAVSQVLCIEKRGFNKYVFLSPPPKDE